jgi:hypothetical protein
MSALNKNKEPACGEWQPIDTAPRNGELFLASFGTGGVLLVRWDRGWELKELFLTPPTHWTPLPKPPTEEITV